MLNSCICHFFEVADTRCESCHHLQNTLLQRPAKEASSYQSTTPIPADTRCLVVAGLTLVQRSRRWTNVKPTLIQRLVSAGMSGYIPENKRHLKSPRCTCIHTDWIPLVQSSILLLLFVLQRNAWTMEELNVSLRHGDENAKSDLCK